VRCVVRWLAAAALAASALQGSAGEAPTAGYAWDLPIGFPEPEVPSDNPMSRSKVELGRWLFYEERLSVTGEYSCASCHQQARAFTDGRAKALGATGGLHPRSAMSLANVAYNARFGWEQGGARSLEAQARIPLLNEAPVELGLAGRTREVVAALARDPEYRGRFERAFPGEPQPVTLENLVRAIAAFERTLVSGRSPYDLLLFRDDRSALRPEAMRGMRLFFSARLGCGACHAGLLLSGDVEGLRAPTLRNIAHTAPYMRDGSVASLAEVVRRYAARGPFPGRSPEQAGKGFALRPEELREVVAFLESLSDPDFLADPRFSDPSAR